MNTINLKPYYNLIYSAEPLSLLTDELEEAVWKEYYLKFIESNIKNIGISSTACYILWQVFNRMADEQYYPPAVPKVDHQKILVKCAKVCFIAKSLSGINRSSGPPCSETFYILLVQKFS